MCGDDTITTEEISFKMRQKDKYLGFQKNYNILGKALERAFTPSWETNTLLKCVFIKQLFKAE